MINNLMCSHQAYFLSDKNMLILDDNMIWCDLDRWTPNYFGKTQLLMFIKRINATIILSMYI